jgi:uncharacterized integral membrane protein (TIGR00697 family)
MKKSVSVLFMFAGILFAICLLISNILATKIILLGSWSAPAGVLVFPIAYIINDVIVEVWGYQKARLIIWFGFAMNIFALLFFSLAIIVPAAPFWKDQEAFATILGSTPRIITASLLAYLIGSFLNAYVMSKVKVVMKGKGFSLRAILSTLIGETGDSMIFITIAFAGNLPVSVLIVMIFTQACIKTVYEIIILPVTILIVKWIKQVEGVDTYDESISYNPFSFNQI